MFVGGIENSTDKTPKTSYAGKNWQLPNAEIRCVSTNAVSRSDNVKVKQASER